MKTIFLRGGRETNKAVKVLTQHLTERGHKIVRRSTEPHDVTVCWGRSTQEPIPALNGFVNRHDKFEAFEAFDAYGVPHPSVFTLDEGVHQHWPGEDEDGKWGDPFPWLAREKHHAKGRDVVVCETGEEAHHQYKLEEKDFFSVFIPTKTEYRVWVFQGKAFTVSEKIFKGEGEYQGYMRNQRFGFKSEKRDDLRKYEPLTVPSINAVKALDLDFGAVDIIEGKDGKFYVLEVNTMPDIDSVKRVSGIRLASRISRWAEQQGA